MGKKGFTVGSLTLLKALLLAVVIIIIPLFSTAREKATQRSTMSDRVKWAKAIESYRNDHFFPPTNPRGKLNYKKAIVSELTPYLEALRIVDWWGYPYWIWTGEKSRLFEKYTAINWEKKFKNMKKFEGFDFKVIKEGNEPDQALNMINKIKILERTSSQE